MAKINTSRSKPLHETHEGAKACVLSPYLQLRRSVLSCMLWEDTFYESGLDIVSRIKDLIPLTTPQQVASLAVEARTEMHLRHIPLLLVRCMARLASHKHLVSETLPKVILRADELTEFLALYWQDEKMPIASQVKKGLAAAFGKFDGYALAKYNRKGAVRLRDVLFLVHPKPENVAQSELWKALAENTLNSAHTWEVLLSAGNDKKQTWQSLLTENKLGALALLRNLSNMMSAGVPEDLIKQAILRMNTKQILPFRFLAAARNAPEFEKELQQAMFSCLKEMERLPGKTVVLLDTSGSMFANLSGRSQMSRLDAAHGLAICVRELCDEGRIFTFSEELVEVPAHLRGFELQAAMEDSQLHRSTHLGSSVDKLNQTTDYDRLIVITDEQSADDVPDPKNKGYMINVAPYKRGVGYGNWTHIDGWSDAVLRFLTDLEKISAEKVG